MPFGDGTGPLGMGPMSGRKLGGCSKSRLPLSKSSIAFSVGGLLLNDLINEKGLIRSAYRRYLGRDKKYISNVEYSVLDDKNKK